MAGLLPMTRRLLWFPTLLLILAPLGAVGQAPRVAADRPPPAHAAAEGFYARMLGDWVGVSVSRVQGQEPSTSYFHLTVSRSDPRTFREQYTYYRRDPKTGALAPSGTQTNLAVLEANEQIRCTASADGTILVDYKPKKQSWQTTGVGRCDGPDRFQADVSGKISVDGMPLGLGKRGRIRSARATWSISGAALLGRTEVESRFRAFVISKSYRVVSEMRAERGRDIHAFAGRQASDVRRKS